MTSLYLLGHQRKIVREVSAQVPCQDTGLHKWHLRQTEILIQQRMRQRVLLAFPIRFDDQLSSRVGELHHSAFSLREVFGCNLLSVYQGNGQAVCQPGAELLHQIQGQRWPVGSVDMKKAHKGVQSHAGESRHTIMAQQSIYK